MLLIVLPGRVAPVGQGAALKPAGADVADVAAEISFELSVYLK